MNTLDNKTLFRLFLMLIVLLASQHPLLAQIDVTAGTNIQAGNKLYITVGLYAVLGIGLIFVFYKISKEGWTATAGFLLSAIILIAIAFGVYTWATDKVTTLIK